MQPRYLAAIVAASALTFALSPLATIGFGGFAEGQFPVQQINPPVQPDGYAFSIWGVIYAWLIIGTGFGFWRAVDNPDWTAMRRPLSISLIIGTFWISAANVSPVLATVMITLMAVTAIQAMLRAGFDRPWLLARPIALYAGWLTAATGVSFGVLLGGYGILSSQAAALICIIGVLVVTLLVQSARPSEFTYPTAVIWALVGVFVANMSAQNWPVVALAAIGIVALVTRFLQTKIKEVNA
jgi:hypothetical protein